MPTPQKEAIVKEMTDKFSSATSIFLADFTGMDVNTVVELRKQFYAAQVEYRIVKNTLAKRSLADAGIEGLDTYLTGVNGYVISYDDPTQPIKVIEKFKKELDGKFNVKAAYFEGKIVESDKVAAISKLPSKQELLGQLVGMLQSPMSKFAATLRGGMSSFVGVLSALEKSKQNS